MLLCFSVIEVTNLIHHGAHFYLFEKVNFIKTSTKIDNTMNYNSIKVASVLQRYRRPQM